MPRHFIAISAIPAMIIPVLIAAVTTPAFAVTRCPIGSATYTLQNGDNCTRIVQRLKLSDRRSFEELNWKVSGFRCGNAQKGQLVCYTKTHNMTPVTHSNSDLFAQAPFSRRTLNQITESGDGDQ